MHPVGAELLHAHPTQLYKDSKTVYKRNHTFGRTVFRCENEFHLIVLCYIYIFFSRSFSDFESPNISLANKFGKLWNKMPTTLLGAISEFLLEQMLVVR